MGYQENEDHVPDPTALSGTLDTTGIYGGHHESLENVTGVFAAARARDLAATNTEDLDDASRAHVEQSAQEAQEHADALGAPALPPNPFPEGTLHAGDVLTPEEQAQRLDPNVPDPLAARAREQGYDVDDDAYRDGPVSDTEVLEPPADAEAYDPSAHNAVEVNEYLAHADEQERERVLAAERAGKARKGVVGE